MANIKSKIKRAKQAKVSALRNKQAKSLIKTKIKKFNEAVEAKDNKAAEQVGKETLVILDKTASKGMIHSNRAAQKKSTIMNKLNKMGVAVKKTAKAAKPKPKAEPKKEAKESEVSPKEKA